MNVPEYISEHNFSLVPSFLKYPVPVTLPTKGRILPELKKKHQFSLVRKIFILRT